MKELFEFLLGDFWRFIGFTIWLMILLEIHKRFWKAVKDGWDKIAKVYENKLKAVQLEKEK